MQTGPNSRATLAVPFACTANSATRMPPATASVTVGVTNCAAPGSVFTPSTADSTDNAGVMMASP